MNLRAIVRTSCILIGLASGCWAGQITTEWIGTGNQFGSWETATNWTPDATYNVPNNTSSNTFKVLIGPHPDNGVLDAVVSSGSFVVDSIALGNSQNHRNLLDVNGSGEVLGNITNYGGFNVGGTLTVDGTLTNSNSLNVYSTGTLNTAYLPDNHKSIGIDGVMNITGGGLGYTDVPVNTSLVVAGMVNVINAGVTTNGLANLATVEGYLYLDLRANGPINLSVNSLQAPGEVALYGGQFSIADSMTVQNLSVLGNKLSVAGTLDAESGSYATALFGDLTSRLEVATLSNHGTSVLGGTACLGSISNGGSLSFANAAPLDGSAGCNPLTDGTLTEIISDTSFGYINDSAEVVQFGGLLNVSLANGFVPTVGQSFNIIEFSGPASDGSTFAGVRNPYFNNGTEQWALSYSSGRVTLTAEAVEPGSAAPEPGTLALFGTGLIVIAGARIRSRSDRSAS